MEVSLSVLGDIVVNDWDKSVVLTDEILEHVVQLFAKKWVWYKKTLRSWYTNWEISVEVTNSAYPN